MKINYHNSFLVAILFLLFACSSMQVDTLNKKIAVFEISYGEVLITIDNLISDNDLNYEQIVKVKSLVNNVATARLALYAALKIDDAETAQEKLNAALTLLQAVKQYIE